MGHEYLWPQSRSHAQVDNCHQLRRKVQSTPGKSCEPDKWVLGPTWTISVNQAFGNRDVSGGLLRGARRHTLFAQIYDSDRPAVDRSRGRFLKLAPDPRGIQIVMSALPFTGICVSARSFQAVIP